MAAIFSFLLFQTLSPLQLLPDPVGTSDPRSRFPVRPRPQSPVPSPVKDQCVIVSSAMAGWTAVSEPAAVAAMSGRASAIFNTSSIVSTM